MRKPLLALAVIAVALGGWYWFMPSECQRAVAAYEAQTMPLVTEWRETMHDATLNPDDLLPYVERQAAIAQRLYEVRAPGCIRAADAALSVALAEEMAIIAAFQKNDTVAIEAHGQSASAAWQQWQALIDDPQ